MHAQKRDLPLTSILWGSHCVDVQVELQTTGIILYNASQIRRGRRRYELIRTCIL